MAGMLHCNCSSSCEAVENYTMPGLLTQWLETLCECACCIVCCEYFKVPHSSHNVEAEMLIYGICECGRVYGRYDVNVVFDIQLY